GQPAAPLSWPPAVVPKRCRPPGRVQAEWPAAPTPANARAIGKKKGAAATFHRWGLIRSTWAALRSWWFRERSTAQVEAHADRSFWKGPFHATGCSGQMRIASVRVHAAAFNSKKAQEIG